MWKRLLDEDTWHGKAIKFVFDCAKIGIVLVYFFGLFVVIAFDSIVRRLRQAPKQGAGSAHNGPG